MSTTKPKDPPKDVPKATPAKPKPKFPIDIVDSEVTIVLRKPKRTKTITASPNKAPGDLFDCVEHKPKVDGCGMSIVGLSKLAVDAGWELSEVR